MAETCNDLNKFFEAQKYYYEVMELEKRMGLSSKNVKKNFKCKLKKSF